MCGTNLELTGRVLRSVNSNCPAHVNKCPIVWIFIQDLNEDSVMSDGKYLYIYLCMKIFYGDI